MTNSPASPSDPRAVGGPHFAATVSKHLPVSGSTLEVDVGAVIDTPTGTADTIVYKAARRRDGSAKELRMDVRLPAGSAALPPVVVFASGGAFRRVDRTSSLDLQEFLVGRGLAVCAAEYRLISDGADFRDGIADVQDAVRHVRRHANELGVDGRLIALWGDSAGGYLAAMAALVGDHLSDAQPGDYVSARVSAVVDRFGLSDLSDVGADFDDESRELLRAPGNFPAMYLHGPDSGLSADADMVLAGRADPATYASRVSPPFLFLHGDDDRIVSPSQTERLHRRLAAVSGHTARYVIPGAGHGDIVPASDPTAATAWHTTRVADLIGSFLKEHLVAGKHP